MGTLQCGLPVASVVASLYMMHRIPTLAPRNMGQLLCKNPPFLPAQIFLEGYLWALMLGLYENAGRRHDAAK
ncbi:hypothetical protein HAX54_052734, partial [Datura stramonium]|nr:hypothetical protein [Datura stramonium]